MERAVGGELGEDIKQARYTTILKTDHGAGAFWGRNGLASPPVYPGSVGIALASNLGVTRWLCGEANGRDRARLRAALPPGSVFKSLISPCGRARDDTASHHARFRTHSAIPAWCRVRARNRWVADTHLSWDVEAGAAALAALPKAIWTAH